MWQEHIGRRNWIGNKTNRSPWNCAVRIVSRFILLALHVCIVSKWITPNRFQTCTAYLFFDASVHYQIEVDARKQEGDPAQPTPLTLTYCNKFGYSCPARASTARVVRSISVEKVWLNSVPATRYSPTFWTALLNSLIYLGRRLLSASLHFVATPTKIPRIVPIRSRFLFNKRAVFSPELVESGCLETLIFRGWRFRVAICERYSYRLIEISEYGNGDATRRDVWNSMDRKERWQKSFLRVEGDESNLTRRGRNR